MHADVTAYIRVYSRQITESEILFAAAFLDVARPRSDARPDFRSVRSEASPSWEAIPRRGVPGRRPRN
eukprot:5339839-Pyramimonas_sp.AAC.1